MGLADVVATLRADTAQFTAKMGEARAEVDKLSKSGASNMEQFNKVGVMAGAAVAAALVAAGVAAVDLAENYNVARKQLQDAAQGSGANFKQVQAAATAADGIMAHYGYTATQVEQATSTLTIAQGSHVKVQQDLTLAANLAAARHIDLASAINLVNKAAEGNTGALKRMGIDLPIAAGGAMKVKSAQDAMTTAIDASNAIVDKYGESVMNAGNKHNAAYEASLVKVNKAQQALSDAQTAGTKIIDTLSQRFGGQAAAEADTFSGRVKTMKAEVENVGISIGQKLLPILDKFMAYVEKSITWLDKHREVLLALGIVIGIVLVAALVAATAAVVSFTAGLVTNPVFLIIAAIVLLVIGIVELAKHWSEVWTDIKTWVADGAAWVRDHFYIIMAIPIVGWMIELAANWRGIWDIIKTVITTAWSYIQPVFNFIKTLGTDFVIANIQLLQGIWNTAWTVISTVVNVAWGVMKGVWDLIEGGISGIETVASGLATAWSAVWNGLGTAVKWAWDNVIQPAIAPITGAINDVKSAWDAVFGGGGGNAPAAAAAGAGATHSGTPARAAGGPVSSLSTYLVGEQGPELFTPSSSGTITPNSALGGGTQMAQVTVPFIVDGQTLATTVQTVLLRYGRGVPTLGFN